MNNQVEVLVETKYQDVCRVQNGIILRVNKYLRTPAINRYVGIPYGHKDKLIKVKGTQGTQIYEVARSFESYDYRTRENIQAGWIIVDDYVYKPTENPEEYWVTMSIAGGAFAGTPAQLTDLFRIIESVLEEYKK